MLIDQGREDRTCVLNKGASGIGPGMLKGNRYQFELLAAVTRVKLLPPGQLFAASSPRSPEEE